MILVCTIVLIRFGHGGYQMVMLGNSITGNKGNYKINPEIQDWIKHRLASTAKLLDRKVDILRGNDDYEKLGTLNVWKRINNNLMKSEFDRALRRTLKTNLSKQGRRKMAKILSRMGRSRME